MSKTTETEDGGPAFPRPATLHRNGTVHDAGHPGMPLRDYLAAHASEEDVLRFKSGYDPKGHHFSNSREHARYAYADAMIKASGRKEGA